MVERITMQKQVSLTCQAKRSLLHRIFDFKETGAPVVTVGVYKQTNELVKKSVAEVFPLKWTQNGSFIRPQSTKYKDRDLNQIFDQLMKPNMNIYGRIQVVLEVLKQTSPQKWVTGKNELNLLKLCNVSEKADQLTRVIHPDKRVIESLSDERLDLLLMFLNEDAQKYRAEFKQYGRNMDAKNVPNFKNALSIVGSCYCKLIWDKINVQITELSRNIVNFDKINEIAEQLTLCTDLFHAIATECPLAFNTVACQSMLYFSHLAVMELKAQINLKKDVHIGLQILAEQVIFSSVTLVSSLMTAEAYPHLSQASLEDIFLARGTQIIKIVLQLAPALPHIFNDNLCYPDNRSMISGLPKTHKTRSLLKIVLSVAARALTKWNEKLKSYPTTATQQTQHKESKKVFENFSALTLQALSNVVQIQIKYYSKTEKVSAEVEALKPQAQPKEEKKRVNNPLQESMTQTKMAAIVEEDEEDYGEEEVVQKEVTASSGSAKDEKFVGIRTGNQPMKHTSARVLSDASVLTTTRCNLDATNLALDEATQRNWISVNHDIFEIATRLLPDYFKKVSKTEKKKDEPGLEKEPNPVPIDSESGYLSLVCSLYKIQFYFLLRYNHFNTYSRYQNADKTSELSIDDERRSCNLSLSIKKFFKMTFTNNPEFNNQVLNQIFDVCKVIIEDKAYNVVDKNQYFQVFWLQQMITQLSYLCEDELNPKSIEIFKIFYTQFKSFFVEDKYLQLLESVFELDQDQLYHIEKQYNDGKSDLTMMKLNRFLIQRYCMTLMISMSSQNSIISGQCWQKVQEEFSENGMCYAIGKTQNDTYDEQTVEIALPQGKGSVSVLEHRHKTTRSLFKTEIYMVIKLAMGLLGFSDYFHNSRKAYHTLTESPQHYELLHKGGHPIRFGNNKERETMEGFIEREPQFKCDDCLRCQFNAFKLPKMINLQDSTPFWKLIFDRIRSLSTALRQQEQAKEEFFNPDAADLMQAVTNSKVNPKTAQLKRTEVPKRNYKISEKIYSILKRFVIYASQNKKIAEYLCAQFIKKPEKDDRDLRKVNLKSKPAPKEDSKQLTGQDFKDIQRDEAFKLLLMRNLIFHTRFKPPEMTDQCQFLLEYVQNTFRQIKFNLNVLVKLQDQFLNKEHEKNTLTNIFEAYMDGSQNNKQPAIPGGQTRQDWLQDKIAKFKEMAHISNSLLKLYINVVCKNKSSLTFLERRPVLDVTIVLLRKIVFAEGSFAVDFIAELLQAYFFEKVEEIDPFKLFDPATQPALTIRNLYVYNPSPVTLTQQGYQEQLIKLIFDSVIEFIRVTKEELLINPEQRGEFKARTLQMVQLLVTKLHEKMFNSQHSNYFALKFARSFKKDSLNQIKKIMIHIREQGQLSKTEYGRDVHDTEHTMSQLRQVLVRVLSVMPRPQQMRDFFTFFRDIFYYQKRLDEVDHLLANDMLQILNGVLKKRTEQLSLDVVQMNPNDAGHLASLVPQPGSFQLKVTDSYMFSKYTPGTIVLNNLKLDQEPSFCILFKVDKEQMLLEAQHNQSKNIFEQDMVIFSILQTYEFNMGQAPQKKTIDVKLRIKEVLDVSRHLRLQYKLMLSADVVNQQTDEAKYRDLDSQWHFLCFRIKVSTFGNPTIEVYMDNFERENKNNTIVTIRGLDPKAQHFFALGNNADILYRHVSSMNYLSNLKVKSDKRTKQTKEETKDDKVPQVAAKEYIKTEKQILANFEQSNTQYYRGQISLPFFMLKVSDMQKYVMADSTLGRAFRDCMIDFISSKKVLNHDGPLDLNYFVYKINKQAKAISTIQQSKKTKEVFDKYETSEDDLKRNQIADNKKNINHQIKQFESLDKYTMVAIHLHTLAVQQRVLCAVHTRTPAEVFTLLGGFKNLYPLVDNVMNSNLHQLCQLKPGQVLSWLFVILNTLLHTDPTHISKMVKKRNMLMTLKFIFLELGRKQMISAELINQVNNVVKRNVLARFRFVKVDDRSEHMTQRYIHTANGTCRAHKKFYQNFLYDFVTEIILDEGLAIQECYFMSTPTANKKSNSKLTEDAPMTQVIKSHFLIEEFIDLIQNICCPPEMKTILQAQLQQREHKQHVSDEGYIDYESLREFIVEREFASKLLKILSMEQLQHHKHLNLLQRLGKCIADTIIFGQEHENLKILLNKIQSGAWKTLSLIKLKVYLLIILRVIRETGFKKKENEKNNELVQVLNKEFKPKEIAKILNQWNDKQILDDETANLQDEIISTVLLILVESYVKHKQEGNKVDHIDNISTNNRNADNERKELITLIQSELRGNQILRENTYYTLMYVAFEKSKVRYLPFHALPKIDDIILMIKSTTLRKDSLDPSQQQRVTSTFDIDFFFLAVEMFRKYNIFTKRIFLTHLHSFLISHQTAFMQIFDDLKADDNILKRKLLDFFFMIITDCITSRDSEIHRYAENILLEVLFFQMMSSQPENPEKNTTFADQQLQTFVHSGSAHHPDKEKKTNPLHGADFDGHKLITQIFMFFKNDNNQFQILIRLLHKLYNQTVGWDDDPNSDKTVIIRLNMKLLQLLQVIEQVFVQKPYIALNEFFIEAMVILMYLLEKLRILDFVLPDKITETFKEVPYSDVPQPVPRAEDVTRSSQQKQQSGVKIYTQKQSALLAVKSSQQSSIKNLADLGMPIKNSGSVVQKESAGVINMPKTGPVLVQPIKMQKAAARHFQFLKGGSFRSLFHIIIKSVNAYGDAMLPEQLATYMDMLRYLFMKEVRGNFRGVLQKHPDFEENIRSVRLAEVKDTKLFKLNAINKAEVIMFILKDNEKTSGQKSGETFVASRGQTNTMVNFSAAVTESSTQSRMRTDQNQNTCWKVYNRDKTIGPQWETFAAIRETTKAQRDEYEMNTLYRNLKYSTEQLGCSKAVHGILPGISMIKGFCATMLIGELIEILSNLLYPLLNESPTGNTLGSGSRGSTRNRTNTDENFSSKIRQPFDDQDSNGSSMEMAFDEEQKERPKFEPLPRSFRVARKGVAAPLEGIGERLSKEDVFKKINDILFFIYETLQEQMFNCPLPISRSDRRTMAISSPEQKTQYSYSTDLSSDAGTIFWDSCDPILRKKLEAQSQFVASKIKETGDYTTMEAQAEIKLLCNTFKYETQVIDTSPKVQRKTAPKVPVRKTTDVSIDLTSSSDPFEMKLQTKLADLGLPVVQEEVQEEVPQQIIETERERFMRQYLMTSNVNATEADVSPIKNFISHLFSRLHKIYGKNTKVNYNEYGGFDFRDNKTEELVSEFNNYRLQFNYEFSEICEFVVNQHRMVALGFAAVSSDMFKEEIGKVYQQAEQSMTQQNQEEAIFERARKESLGTIRRGLNISMDQMNDLAFVNSHPSGLTSGNLSSIQEEVKADIIEYKVAENENKPPKREAMFRLDIIYTKKQFKKQVKWCREDPSNIWCDQLEQEMLDFAEVKNVYNKDILKPNIKTAESQRTQNYANMLKEYQSSGEDPRQIKFINDYKVNYGEIFVNPQFHQSFVKLRMQTDKWGRRMLLKPNRKYHEGQHLQYYKYVANDYFNKWFAVSLLDDQDQNDCLVPQGQNDYILQHQSGGQAAPALPKLDKFNSENHKLSKTPLIPKAKVEVVQKASEDEEEDPFELAVRYYEDPKTLERFMQPKFSKNLQRIRNDLLSRLDRSRLLQSIMFTEGIGKKTKEDQMREKRELSNQEKLAKKKLWLRNIIKQEQVVEQDETFDAEMFFLKTYFGKIVVTQDYFVFLSFGLPCPEDDDEVPVNDKKYKFRSNDKDFKGDARKLIYRWHEIEEILVKPFFGPTVGVEIYISDKKSFTFNLLSALNLKKFLSRVKSIKSFTKDNKQTRKLEFNLIEDPIEAFKQCGFAESWKLGEKSNQEFLLLLNKYSGRTYNFWQQYPFFPHVLTNFSDSLIEFNDCKNLNQVYRDFKRSSTCMFEDKEFEYWGNVQKENMLCATCDAGYQLKPSHGYQDALRVGNLMQRLEPYTSQYLTLNGTAENADRIHASNQWIIDALKVNDLSFTNELMPEFFYLPELFTNENLVHCNVTTEQKNVDQWYLPKWALNHYDLVRVMRESLESKYVQENLGTWIDIVFGCDQFSEEKFTQFYPWCYPQWWDDRDSDMFKNWKTEFPKLDQMGNDIENLESELEKQYIYNISVGYLNPYKLFQNSIMHTEKEKNVTQEDPNNPNFGGLEELKVEEAKQPAGAGKKAGGPNIDNLINHFVANIENATRSELKLNRCADYQVLEPQHDIVHMIIISQQKQCLAFLRIDDRKNKKNVSPNSVPTGKIVVYCNRVNISKDTFQLPKQYDLQLRYEHVHHELDNIFAEFSCKYDRCIYKEERYLYVCGYLDNSIKIFDLKKKPGEHFVKQLKFNNARVTCIKFSKDYKYLITCDADGVIHHYEKKCHMTDHTDVDAALSTTVFRGKCKNESLSKKKEHFPFTLLNVIQDQMDEIVALDINDTLDMYVTLSRDGTIALRCLRTSKLWRHFKLLYKLETKGQDDKVVTIKGFVKNFKHVNALKLSLHGYIVVCGPSSRQPNVSQYLVYSINGDLLRAALEKVEIKNVFLNSREDQLIIATNFANTSQTDKNIQNVNGNLRVLNLYGLEKIANLTKVVYIETINFLQNDQNESMQMQRAPEVQTKLIPSIQAMVVGQAERNMNIFFVKKQIDNNPGAKPKNDRESKEIICFDSGMDAVWSHFKNYGIAR